MIAAFAPHWPLLGAAFEWLVRATWQASALAMLVVAAQMLLRSRLTARRRCLLWSIVVARLLLPPLPEWRPTLLAVHRTPALVVAPAPSIPAPIAQIDSPHPSALDPRRVAALRAELAALPDDDMTAMPASPVPTPALISVTAPPAPGVVTPPTRPNRARFLLARTVAVGRPLLPWAWLAGMVVALARLAFGSVRLSRSLSRLPALDDPGFTALLQSCAVEMGLRHVPVVLVADHLTGPALAGAWRPRLLVPRRLLGAFPPAEMRLMVLHELAHIRRRDIGVNWLLCALAALHWFNPILVAALRRARADRELACDETVLAVSQRREDRRVYGHTLLRLAEQLSLAHDPLEAGALGILQNKRHLERRILMILRFNPASRSWPELLTSGLVLLGAVALVDAAEPATTPNPGRPAVALTPPALAAPTPVAPEPAARPQADPDNADAIRMQEYKLAAKEAELKMYQARLDRARQAYKVAAGSASEVEEAEAQLAKAKAELEQSRYELSRAKRGATGSAIGMGAVPHAEPEDLKVIELRIQAAEINLQHAQRTAERLKALVANGVVSAEEHERAQADLAMAQVNLAMEQAKLNQAKRAERATAAAPAAAVASAPAMGGNPMAAGDVGAVVQDAEAQRLDAQTAEKLRKPMKLKIVAMPLDKAIELVQQAAGVDIILDRHAIYVDGRDRQVESLILDQPAPAAQVLCWILLNAGGDAYGFAIDHGAVLVSTRAQLDRLTVTRAYDITDLQGRENLVELVPAIVAPGSWREHGGSIGAVRQFGTKLLITQTEPNHAQVDKLLGLLRKPGTGGAGGLSFTQPRASTGAIPDGRASVSNKPGQSTEALRAEIAALTELRNRAAEEMATLGNKKREIDKHQQRADALEEELRRLSDIRDDIAANLKANPSFTPAMKIPEIEDRMKACMDKMRAEKKALNEIASDFGTSDLSVLYQSKVSTFNRVDAQLSEAKLNLALGQGNGNALKIIDDLSNERIGMLDAGMARKLEALADAKAELEKLKASFGERHPRVVEATRQVAVASEAVERYASEFKKLNRDPAQGAVGPSGKTSPDRIATAPAPVKGDSGIFDWMLSAPRESARRQVTANNMRQLLLAAIMYANDHDAQLPQKFPDDFRPYLGDGADKFLANPRTPDKKIGYTYTRPAAKLTEMQDVPLTILLQEAVDQWGDGIFVGFADGHVEFVSNREEFLKKYHLTAAKEGAN